MTAAIPLLEVSRLQVRYPGPKRGTWVRAVSDVSFSISAGESVGLVGESGCGKSTIANAILGLVSVQSGDLRYKEQSIVNAKGTSLAAFRRQVQMVFQDPFGSLNPRMTIGAMIAEVLRVHNMTKGREAIDRRVAELLTTVGLDPAYSGRYPHEFSGGQRQRICMARALAVNPVLLIADEPVSALDVSVQAQILSLMKMLQQKMDLSLLFIAHDLAVVRAMCTRVLVMYLGHLMESGPVELLYAKPAHPYTEALLSAVPDVERGLAAREGKSSGRIVLQGDVPSPTTVIQGCPFHPRCPRVIERCRNDVPALREIEPGHFSACHVAETVQARPHVVNS
jgi:oligopeptide transport system ATP-binding protein